MGTTGRVVAPRIGSKPKPAAKPSRVAITVAAARFSVAIGGVGRVPGYGRNGAAPGPKGTVPVVGFPPRKPLLMA